MSWSGHKAILEFILVACDMGPVPDPNGSIQSFRYNPHI